MRSPKALADEWKTLLKTDSSEYHDQGKVYVTISPERRLLRQTIKALSEADK